MYWRMLQKKTDIFRFVKFNIDYSVKSLASRHACMVVEQRLYDTPHNEEEVGKGPHEFRIVGRIAGAVYSETIRKHLLTF